MELFKLLIIGNPEFKDFYLFDCIVSDLLITKRYTHQIKLIIGTGLLDKLIVRYAKLHQYECILSEVDYNTFRRGAIFHWLNSQIYKVDAVLVIGSGLKSLSYTNELCSKFNKPVRNITYE